MDLYTPPPSSYVCYTENTRNYQESKRREVRSAYGSVAQADNEKKSCGNGRSCCGVSAKPDEEYCQSLGYSKEDLSAVPEGANMGLGCGNPGAIAALKPGEVVLDLGSGGGFDAFLAARKVGKTGKVYGVDMTPDMLGKARLNAQKAGYSNVEFLLGEIEHLPLGDSLVDVVISNCVINLSPDKKSVFSEVFRVLKSGGRIAISDMVALKPLPKEMQENANLYCNCISGAITIDELKEILQKSGFKNINILVQEESKMFIKEWVPGSDAENYVISAKITAVKP